MGIFVELECAEDSEVIFVNKGHVTYVSKGGWGYHGETSTISLITGARISVKESVGDVIKKINEA